MLGKKTMQNNNEIILKAINKSYQKGDNTVVVHDNFNLTIKSGEIAKTR